MSEDFNEFNSWDCGGAAAMLAVVPAVFYFVNSEHDLAGTAIMASIAVGVGLFIFVVAHLTDSRLVGRILQLIGILLCIGYWVFAIHMWSTNSKFSPPDPADIPADNPKATAFF